MPQRVLRKPKIASTKTSLTPYKPLLRPLTLPALQP
jgi:hypothetical protein